MVVLGIARAEASLRIRDGLGCARATVGREQPTMKCPHCTIHFHDNWFTLDFVRYNSVVANHATKDALEFWKYRSASCPDCRDVTIEIARFDHASNRLEDWRQVYPIGANRGPVPPEVPKKIAEDYIEACSVLPMSAKASAALSRRCLQNVLHAHGYRARDLAKEIDLLLDETDPKKALPYKLPTGIADPQRMKRC